MYSPKISEALIPRIYRAAQEANVPMTAWVNQAVERALPNAAELQVQEFPPPAILHDREIEGTNGESRV